MMAKYSKSVPCRLYAILAREAPVGVVFRRGPSKWVQTIGWDTSTDKFTPGQWFHGRIYERRCDLSPNGTLLAYFAMDLSSSNPHSDRTYAWTAVSRAPYLTELAVWPKGNCWGGGGLFESNCKFWLNHDSGMTDPNPNYTPQGLTVTHDGGGAGEDWPIYSARLERDGWRQAQQMKVEYTRTNAGLITHVPGIHYKQNPRGKQMPTMTRTLSGFRSDEDIDVSYDEGKHWHLKGAAWADWDQRGRLVFARDGRLFALHAEDIGLKEPQELIDMNNHKPAPTEVPEWAKSW